MLPYLAFLERHASVKLYWPEFKRKHKNAPEMRDVKLTDKIREKWYRDYVSRMSRIIFIGRLVPLWLLGRY